MLAQAESDLLAPMDFPAAGVSCPVWKCGKY